MIAIALTQFGLMTVRDVAAFHRTTPRCVWRWVAEERITAIPVERCLLIPRAACEQFQKPRRGRKRGAGRGAEGPVESVR